MNWKDLPRSKDQLAIVGFSPTTRHLAPFDSPDHEVYILNEEYAFPWCKRYDRTFQMHQRWDFMRQNNSNHPNHPLWLTNRSDTCMTCKGTGSVVQVLGSSKEPQSCPDCTNGIYTSDRNISLPIYMQQEYPDIPGSVEFPLDEVTKLLGKKYYRSGFSYMMGLALLLEYPRIELYGFEMGSGTEYHYQKANGEWLVGLAMGKGIDVYLPDDCTLLKGPVYGYEDSRIGYRQNLETRLAVLNNQITKQKTVVAKAEAESELVRSLLEKPDQDLMALMAEKAQNYNQALGMLNFVRGAKTETDNLTSMYDKYYSGPKEIDDPIAYNYRIVEQNVKVEYAPEN